MTAAAVFNDRPSTRVFQWLMSVGLFLFIVSYYFPLPSKALFYAGIILPGLAWLIYKPKALPAFLQAFAWMLLPLALLQLLNVQAWHEIKLWLYLMGFLACCVFLDRRGCLEKILTIFSYVSLAVLVYCSFDWVIIHQQTGEWVRYALLFGNGIDPIDIAMMIATGLLYLWLNKAEPGLQAASSFHLLTGILILSGLILLTAIVFQARTLLLAYAFFLLAYLYYRRLWLFGFTAVLAVFFIGYWAGMDHLLLERGLSYRPQIWFDTLHRVTHVCNIWSGCGKDGYRFLGLYTHTHNFLLQILYEDGLAGLAIFSFFAYVFVKRGNRSNALLLAALGIGAQMSNTGWLLVSPKSLWVYFWLPITLTAIEISRDKMTAYWMARGEPSSQMQN